VKQLVDMSYVEMSAALVFNHQVSHAGESWVIMSIARQFHPGYRQIREDKWVVVIEESAGSIVTNVRMVVNLRT